MHRVLHEEKLKSFIAFYIHIRNLRLSSIYSAPVWNLFANDPRNNVQVYEQQQQQRRRWPQKTTPLQME